MAQTEHDLVAKLKVLNETVWEQQVDRLTIDAWLANFADLAPGPLAEQRLHALYLLSRFMYFGRREMRELLRALFRDLYRYPVIENIRRANADTIDRSFLKSEFIGELERTRFLGVGNPSESGTHLLYYFRQENGLSSDLFINTHQVFTRSGATAPKLRDPSISRYVFIDDFCGSGTQAVQYSQDIVDEVKRINGAVEISYYVLFATSNGLQHVRNNASFDRVDAIFELDDTYKCFGTDSRYFRGAPAGVSQKFAEAMSRYYGQQLWPSEPLGFKNGQLLMGFYHNTPDNTLPIIWFSEPNRSWVAAFRRYPKLYNWGGI
jgi:hypothetical protein